MRWWPGSSWNRGLGEEKGPAVWAGSLEEVKQREGEERREQPGCSMRVDLLAVMLSNSPQHRTVGGSKRIQRMMRVKELCFLTPKGSRRGQCNSICTCEGFYLCYKLKVQKGWCLMITKKRWNHFQEQLVIPVTCYDIVPIKLVAKA